MQPFAFMSKPQMKEITDENEFDIPYNLRLDEYRRYLSNAINGVPENVKPMDDLQLSLTKAMLAASFMKPLKRDSEERQSKYAVLG